MPAADQTCLRCREQFKDALPSWQTAQLCDRCFGWVMNYITTAATMRQSFRRVKAAQRLYGRRES